MNIKIKQIDYHRNGTRANGFHAVLFSWEKQNFLATVFDGEGDCAVICLDMIATSGVSHGSNSWRGDDFEDALRKAIKDHWSGLQNDPLDSPRLG